MAGTFPRRGRRRTHGDLGKPRPAGSSRRPRGGRGGQGWQRRAPLPCNGFGLSPPSPRVQLGVSLHLWFSPAQPRHPLQRWDSGQRRAGSAVAPAEPEAWGVLGVPPCPHTPKAVRVPGSPPLRSCPLGPAPACTPQGSCPRPLRALPGPIATLVTSPQLLLSRLFPRSIQPLRRLGLPALCWATAWSSPPPPPAPPLPAPPACWRDVHGTRVDGSWVMEAVVASGPVWHWEAMTWP